MNEIWKNIKGFEGLYQVSNIGRVKSLKYGKEKIMKPGKDKYGYLYVCLCKYRKRKYYYVHRMVAEAFLDNPDGLPQVNHKNEDKTDNRVENLEFCSVSYNMNYGTRNQRIADKKINGKTSKTVYQYTLDGVLIAEYPSAREVQRQLVYASGAISQCCNGKRKTAYGFIWRYIKEPRSN